MLKFENSTVSVMTLDDRIRLGMMALGGATLVLTAMGVHVTPLTTLCGAGEL